MGLLDHFKFEAGVSTTSGPYLAFAFDLNGALGDGPTCDQLASELKKKERRINELESKVRKMDREGSAPPSGAGTTIIPETVSDVSQLVTLADDNPSGFTGFLRSTATYTDRLGADGSLISLPDVPNNAFICAHPGCIEDPIAGKYCPEHFCNTSDISDNGDVFCFEDTYLAHEAKVGVIDKKSVLNECESYKKEHDYKVGIPLGFRSKCEWKGCKNLCSGVICNEHSSDGLITYQKTEKSTPKSYNVKETLYMGLENENYEKDKKINKNDKKRPFSEVPKCEWVGCNTPCADKYCYEHKDMETCFIESLYTENRSQDSKKCDYQSCDKTAIHRDYCYKHS